MQYEAIVWVAKKVETISGQSVLSPMSNLPETNQHQNLIVFDWRCVH